MESEENKDVNTQEEISAGIQEDNGPVIEGATALPQEEVPAEPSQAVDPKPTELIFNGQVIISDGVRMVEGKEVRHVKLADGTEVDLSDEEYQAVIDAAK